MGLIRHLGYVSSAAVLYPFYFRFFALRGKNVNLMARTLLPQANQHLKWQLGQTVDLHIDAHPWYAMIRIE